MEDKPGELDILALISRAPVSELDGFTSTELYDRLRGSGSSIGKNRLIDLLRRAVQDGKLEAAWLERTTAWGVTIKRQGYRVAE